MFSKFEIIVKLVVILFTFKGNCFQTDWELKQFTDFSNVQYFANIPDFETPEEVIDDARNKTQEWMHANLVPGVVIGMSVKGKTVWSEAFGYTDIENNVKTDMNSVWRLASISKPLTSALMGKLMDKKLVELNESVYQYLPQELFPKKTFDGKAVDITVREVLSHMAGLHLTQMFIDFAKVYKASNVSQTIESLKNESLLSRPGTEFGYSNYGFQMAGAVIESVLKNSFQKEIQLMCEKLGMKSTFAEIRGEIFKHRPRYYHLKDYTSGPLENSDIFDELFSYEGWWPSGGMVSTVDDLLIFGNAMLSSYKGQNNSNFYKFSYSVIKYLFIYLKTS